MDTDLALSAAYARCDHLEAELRRVTHDHQAAYDQLAQAAERDLADANRLLTQARLDAHEARKAFDGEHRLTLLLQARLDALQAANEQRDNQPQGGFESPARPHPVRGALSLPVWKAPTR